MTARMVVMVLLVLLACDKKSEPQSAPEPTAPGSAGEKAESDEGARGDSVSGAAGGIAAGLDDIANSKPRVAPSGTTTAAATPPVTPPTPSASPTPSAPPSGSNTAAAPPPLSPGGTVAAADTLKVGDRVMARWTNGSWYPGKIVAITADGKYDVNYDDGDKSRGLPASKVRKKTATAGGTTSKASKASASDAPCPGPGLTRRCNGVCVNIQENSNHCGGCNNKCPSGKACDGHMSCRDAEGNL